MCSYNFFPFSIGFIYFLSALLLRLLWQSAFYLPSPFLCSQPISQNTITLAAPAAADADVLNSISIHCCNVRERDRYGGERIGGGWQIQDCLHPFFFLSLKGIIIGAWCSSAHHDVAWISFSASGSSGDEYILTRSDRHTWSKYTRTTARSAATKVRVCLQSEAGLWSPAAVRLKHVCVHIRGNAHILFCSSAFTPSLAVLIE